jgi:general secretion pathway protein M
MKEWWLSKTPREQQALVIGAAALLLMLLYLVIWEPFANAVDEKRQQVESQRITLDWMEQNLAEVLTLRNQQRAGGGARGNEALLTLVDRTAKQNQMRQQITTIKPQGEDKVQLRIEQAAFDTLLKWLDGLTGQHGIAIESLNVDRQQQPGLVNARLVLQRSGGA